MVSRGTPQPISASAKSSPSRKLSRESPGISETERMASRTSGRYGTVLAATTLMRSATSTTATSMPSAEVPLIRPAILMRRAGSQPFQFLLQFIQQLQGFNRAELIYFEIAYAFGDRLVDRLEKLDLHRAGRPRREFLGYCVLGALVQCQNVAGSLNHRYGQTGQPRDLDAIAAVGAAGLDFAEEDHLIAGFLHGYMQIADSRQLIGEFGELVVMGCKQRAGADALVDVLDDGPGQRQPIVSSSAAPDFVQDYQAARSRGIQNDGGLGHLHHKRRTAARQVVRGADTGEHAIDDRKSRRAGRDERADLGQNHDHCSLAQVGRFATHVRARDDQEELAGRMEVKVVGDETQRFLFGQLFDNGMAASDDSDFARA